MRQEQTLLLIDSEESIQDAIKEKFSLDPVRIVPILKAEDALVAAMTELPSAIVMALELEDGDGLNILRNIRLMDAEVPVIVLIGKPTKEKVIEAKKANAVDILLKPPDFDRIRAKLESLFWPEPGEGEEAAPVAPEEETREFVEAVPKGAEVLNINDAYQGMKLARTLVWNDVVYADKGQLLTEEKLRQLNRIGVAEVCVYENSELKRLALERKKRLLQQRAITASTLTAEKGGATVFSKVKREDVRIPTDIICKIGITNEAGERVETNGNIVDISGGGCALLTPEHLKKDSQIYLSFMLEDLEFKEVRGVVRHSVARNGKPPDFPIRSGIFFDSITVKFREDLINKLFKIQREQKAKELDKKPPSRWR